MTVVADLGSGFPADWFGHDLKKHSGPGRLEAVEDILRSYCRDEAAVATHYPWVAMALDKYAEAQSAEPTLRAEPSDCAETLREIGRLALSLNDQIKRLNATVDAALINRPKWLAFARAQHDVFAEFGGHEPTGFDPDARFAFEEWRGGLALLWSGARAGADRIEGARGGLPEANGKRPWHSSISGGAGERIAGIDRFVGILGAAWQSFRGRKPSAGRISGDLPPPFVRFVRKIAAVYNLPRPDAKQVAVALKRLAEWQKNSS